MKIFLLNAGVDYEGHSTIKAFTNFDAASDCCAKLREWLKGKPPYPAEDNYDEYFKVEGAWKATCPVPGGAEYSHCDYFDVQECELDECVP